jgi:GNAT superfamily N-acetyltransferase
MPLVTPAVADRIETALVRASASRIVHIARLSDNPLEFQTRTFANGLQAQLIGRELAYYAYFSGPLDVRGDFPKDTIAELAAWYRAQGAPCYVRVASMLATERLLASLSAAGLQESDSTSALFGAPGSEPHSLPPEVAVERPEEQAFEVFLDVWTAGAPASERALRQRLAREEFTDWLCFVARCEGRPSAHAAMYLDELTHTAVLAAAGTLPEFRRRGCQTALVEARLTEAARQGYQLAVVEARPDSSSYRNLERVGLRPAYTRTMWTF